MKNMTDTPFDDMPEEVRKLLESGRPTSQRVTGGAAIVLTEAEFAIIRVQFATLVSFRNQELGRPADIALIESAILLVASITNMLRTGFGAEFDKVFDSILKQALRASDLDTGAFDNEDRLHPH